MTTGILQIEVTDHEREVLLRGLRYVRSSIILEMRDPSPDDEYRRDMSLEEIQLLRQRLESADSQYASH